MEGERAGLMRRSWWLTAFVLSIAGLVCVAAVRGNGSEPKKTPLATALQNRRLIEPRLTGGFDYVPCKRESSPRLRLPEVKCSDLPSWGEDSYEDFFRILEVKEKPGGISLHDRGIFQLITGEDANQTAAAIRKLQEAAKSTPSNASLLNDLAAAYYAQAFRTDEPEDLVRALDTAARAREADRHLPEARFNLALALDQLHLVHLAARAWQSYLEVDSTSGWATEARSRLSQLGKPSAAEQWSLSSRALQLAVSSGDGEQIRRIVKISPQEAREYAFEVAFGQWGAQVQAGDSDAAAQALRVAFSLGNALASLGGDHSVSEAVEAIKSRQTDSPGLHALARGHQDFQVAMKAFRALRTEEAAEKFERAHSLFVQGHSPMRFWALCGLARCWGYEGKYEDAGQAYEQILAEAELETSPSLKGWAEWGLGWVAARQGKYGDALRHTLSMRDGYQKAGESESLGFARFLLGQSLMLLGQKRSAWQDLYQALEALSEEPASFRRHVLLMGSSADAFEDSLPHAALLFREECLWAAEEAKDPIRRAEARWAMSEALAALGRTRQALAELDAARAIVQTLPEDPPIQKLRADVFWIEGQLWASAKPRRALTILTAAVDEYDKLNAPLSIAYTSLLRARVERSLGLKDAAYEDLAGALSILEDPGSRISEEDLRLSYSESVQDVYDEMILSQWVDQRQPNAALETLERARAFQAQTDVVPRYSLSRLPGDRLVIEYALLRDRLLTWTIYQGRISAFEQGYGATRVEGMVDQFLEALQKKDEGEALRLSSELYEILIPVPVGSLPPDVSISIIPDRILNKVPFAGLRSPRTGKFLVESHPVALAPGLFKLTEAVRQPAQPISSALLVGNPSFDRRMFPHLKNLSGSENELALARAAFPRTLSILREEATTPRFLAELDRYEVLVFAGHTVANSNLPSRSYMVLAPSGDTDSGVLLAREISRSRFRRLRTVVLSACESAGPRSARTAGIAGLAKPFLDGGVRSVVATLWPVEDLGTGIMEDFYAELGEEQEPLRALRGAQLEAIRRARPLRSWSALAVVEGN